MLDHLQVEAVNAPVRVTWRVRTLIYERGVEQCVILCLYPLSKVPRMPEVKRVGLSLLVTPSPKCWGRCKGL